MDAPRDTDWHLVDFGEHAAIGLRWMAPDGTILWANPAELRMLGYDRDEYIGRSMSEFHADREALDEMLARLARREVVEDYQARLLCKDGSARDVLISSSAFWAEGRLAHARCVTRDVASVWVARDVGGRKRAERSVRLLAEAGRLLARLEGDPALASVAQLAVPLLADWCTVHLYGRDGVLRLVAPSAADASRCRAGQELAQRYAARPPSGDAARADGHRVERAGVDRLAGAGLPAELAAALAALGVHSYICAPLQARRELLGVIVLAADSPARRLTAEDEVVAAELGLRVGQAVEHARLLHELQEAHRVKDEFLALLSHELRTPLNAIVGWIHLLREGRVDPLTQQRGLDAIQRNADAQAKLINDVLDLSRIEAGKLRLEILPISLAAIARAALESVRPAAQQKRLDILESWECDGRIEGDAERLQQLVASLLSNAVKFTGSGGRIELRLWTGANEDVHLSVCDSGVGIDAAFLPRVFECFRQADGTATHFQGGLGLGLAIAWHIADLHGGRLSAESPGRGEGATFTLRLPAGAGASTSTLVASPAAPRAGAPPRLEGVHVLVVDDQADARDVLSALLGHAGAAVATADCAASAFSWLQQHDSDVLLCDIAMPGETGYDLLRRLRAEQRTCRLPALALTAHTLPEDREQSLRAGFQRHLAKPVEPEELLDAIESVFRSGPC